ncbi:MAG: MFS transporter [Pseudomonadota bacterium]
MTSIATVARPGASRRASTETAVLLFLCFILAQADKQVMGLLAVPVQAEFGLSNTQLGFLQGVAFAVAYAIGGIPIAWLLDGGHRIRIASACVAIWSVATLLCGVAGSFVTLALFRAATAIAEAGLPPAAFSIFSQRQDRRSVARLSSMFMMGPFVGGGLVLLLGGMVLTAMHGSSFALPLWSAPWRLIFLALGIPGLLLAGLLLVRGHEPERPVDQAGVRQVEPLRAVLRAIFVESRFLRFYYPAMISFTLVLYALTAWYPALLVRGFGMEAGTAGGYAGSTYLVAGILGTLGMIGMTGMAPRLSIATLMRTYLIAAVLLVPAVILLPLVGDARSSLILYGVFALVAAAIVSSMAVPIQFSLPNRMQARGIAIFSLLTSAGAGSAGPLIVGVLADHGLPLGRALAITSGSAAAVTVVLLVCAFRAAPTHADG